LVQSDSMRLYYTGSQPSTALVLMNPKNPKSRSSSVPKIQVPTTRWCTDYCHCSNNHRVTAWGKHSLQSPGRWKSLSVTAGRLEQTPRTSRRKGAKRGEHPKTIYSGQFSEVFCGVKWFWFRVRRCGES
jgi:hypothetical protein